MFLKEKETSLEKAHDTYEQHWKISRSSCPEVFYKKSSEKFRKTHRKTPLFACFKLQAQASKFIKKETLAQVLSSEFWENVCSTVL